MAYFQGRAVSFREGILQLNLYNICRFNGLTQWFCGVPLFWINPIYSLLLSKEVAYIYSEHHIAGRTPKNESWDQYTKKLGNHVPSRDTPSKSRMKAEHHHFSKENDLSNVHFGCFMFVFYSCMLENNHLRIIEKIDCCNSWDLDFTLLSHRKVIWNPKMGCIFQMFSGF